MLAARAKSLIDGRLSPSIDDVIELAHSTLRHRMSVNFAARGDDVTVDSIITEICATL